MIAQHPNSEGVKAEVTWLGFVNENDDDAHLKHLCSHVYVWVSPGCIRGSCALNIELCVWGDGLVEPMPKDVHHFRNANIEATVWLGASGGRVFGILQDRANVVIILCNHRHMSCSKHVILL